MTNSKMSKTVDNKTSKLPLNTKSKNSAKSDVKSDVTPEQKLKQKRNNLRYRIKQAKKEGKDAFALKLQLDKIDLQLSNLASKSVSQELSISEDKPSTKQKTSIVIQKDKNKYCQTKEMVTENDNWENSPKILDYIKQERKVKQFCVVYEIVPFLKGLNLSSNKKLEDEVRNKRFNNVQDVYKYIQQLYKSEVSQNYHFRVQKRYLDVEQIPTDIRGQFRII